MTDNRRIQARAVFLVAIMAISVVGMSVAFAGSAAATVDDFDGLDADDVTAGTSGVSQDVTLQGLENDGTAATITITSALDDSVITGASVKSANSHDVTGVNVQSNGDIVVDLGTSESDVTADLVLDVTHDLSSTQDTTVTYTATTDSGISQTATFDVSVAQPEFGDDDAVIPETNPDTLEVTFDEPVQMDDTPGDVSSAFTLSSAGGVSVDGFSEIKNDDTVVLDLSGNVAADQNNPTLQYDDTDNDDPVRHADDIDVDAQVIDSDKSVVSNAVPIITSAVVEGDDKDQIVITTSENVNGDSAATDAFSLGDDQAGVDGVDTEAGGDTTIELSLDSDINPGADLTGLSYDREAGDVVATADTDDELYAQGVTVSNNVAPSIQSAEVTSANPDRILVTYDSPVQSGDDGDVLADFTVGTLSIDGADNADFTAGTDSQVALPLEGTAQASQGDFTNLDYTAGADGVESTAGTAATPDDTGNDVTNNVEPIITDATVQDSSPGEVQVTFRENVVSNLSSIGGSPTGNLDSAVTEAFEFKNTDVDLRIKNVQSFDAPSNTITLNFGLADGTDQEVSATDDLAGALTYKPEDPTDANEKYPLIADGGTDAPVPQTQNFDVTNNVDVDFSVAKVITNGDEIRVTFTENVNKVGTVSEIEDAFVVNSDVVTLDGSNTFSGIEDGDTVVFDRSQEDVDFVDTESAYHSGTDFTTESSNGIDYTAADGNNPLEVAATDTAVGDFDSSQDITNNIQPRIESAEVTNANPGEIQVTYTEDISSSDGSAYESFSLDGDDAPDIDGQNENSNNEIDLELGSTVANGDDLGTLTYTDSDSEDEIKSGNTGNTIALDGDSVTVSNNVGTAPVLQNVTIDDGDANDDSSDGEMLLAFDRDVVLTDQADDDTSGLTFTSNNEEVSVSTDNLANPDSSPPNVIVATFTSDSGSTSSSIQDGDDLSSATLEVAESDNVDIRGDEDGNKIAENTVSDVRNEIAGDLSEVDTSTIDVSVLGQQLDQQTGDLSVTVSGFSDDDGNQVIDGTIDISIGSYEDNDDSNDLSGIDLSDARYDDTITVTEEISTANVEPTDIGTNPEVNVTYNPSSEEITPDNPDTVEFVDEAFTGPDSADTFITSQPLPGELVYDEGQFGSIYAYNASAPADGNQYPSYSELSTAQKVHHGLFMEATEADAAYGFVYDREANGIGVSEYEMPEGWNVIGSNFQIENNDNIDADRDLGFTNQPFPSDDGVRITALNDDLQGTQLGSPITSGTAIEDYEAYYVNMGSANDREIVTASYAGTGSGV